MTSLRTPKLAKGGKLMEEEEEEKKRKLSCRH
jgi:hypothetical protein